MKLEKTTRLSGQAYSSFSISLMMFSFVWYLNISVCFIIKVLKIDLLSASILLYSKYGLISRQIFDFHYK